MFYRSAWYTRLEDVNMKLHSLIAGVKNAGVWQITSSAIQLTEDLLTVYRDIGK